MEQAELFLRKYTPGPPRPEWLAGGEGAAGKSQPPEGGVRDVATGADELCGGSLRATSSRAGGSGR